MVLVERSTLMWQLWVTLDGDAVNWVAAYRSQGQVDAAMQELQQVGATGDLFDVEKLRTLLDWLYADRDAEPQPMPEAEQVIRLNMRGTGSWK